MTNPLAQDLGGVVLAACPFCGCAMRFDSNRDWHHLTGQHEEHCLFELDDPVMTVPATDDAKAWATTAWNTRTRSAEIAGALRDAEAWERRFTEMLIGVINDTQNALGFTDEEKECSNGSLEIVAEIRELQENAARYLWLRSRLAGKEHVAELIEYSDDLSSEVDAAIDSAMQQGGGGG